MNVNFKRGFTLIELVAVIAVIAILIALLLPALSIAKARAKRTACLANLRQINLGVRMYSDDHEDASPTPGAASSRTNPASLYSGYKQLMKSYVGLRGASSSQDKLFACPADTFYFDFFFPTNNGPPFYVRQSFHDQSFSDYSSYGFNGGSNIPAFGTSHPGLGNRKLGVIRHPITTVLVAEFSAFIPWSWHEPKPPPPAGPLLFDNAKNIVSFADGHVAFIKIHWGGNNPPGVLALHSDPPAGYDYQWSAD